jgi:hypothetical protein
VAVPKSTIASGQLFPDERLLPRETSKGAEPAWNNDVPRTPSSVEATTPIPSHLVPDPASTQDDPGCPDGTAERALDVPVTADAADEAREATESLNPPLLQATEADSLQFESFVWRAIRGRYQNFVWWGAGEILLCLGVFSYVEHQQFLYTVKDYFLLILIGALAINGNLFFLLFISERIRKLRSFVEQITGDKSVTSELYRTILYQHVALYVGAGLCIVLGYFTFAELGIGAPIPIVKGIKMALFVVFGTLGLVIGFVMNVWRFFLRLGPLIRNIDTSNPDRMGGLQPIGELNSRLLYIGGALIAVYTFGAAYSPYEYAASKDYAYLWTVMAVTLWIIAVFVPTGTIHQVLKNAKLDQQNQLARVKRRILLGFEQAITETKISTLDQIESYANSVKSAVDVLKYFEQDLELMATWPYHNIGKTLAKLLSIQAIVNLLVHWSDVTRLFDKSG